MTANMNSTITSLMASMKDGSTMTKSEVEQIVEAIDTLKSNKSKNEIFNTLISDEKLEIGDRLWIQQLSLRKMGLKRKQSFQM